MDPVDRFAALVGAGDPPLDRALALVAATERDGVDPDEVVGRLDLLASGGSATSALGLCAELFGPEGFRGDRSGYFHPDNSRLDRVLERRRGIPITLSVVAMEVGRRRGIEVVGVGMPGHFLIGAAGAYIDVFDGARVLDREGCRRLFHLVHGPGAPWADRYLRPVSNLAIVVRVINNLRVASLRTPDRDGLVAALRLQSVLPGAGPVPRRQLAGVLSAAGRFSEAAAVLEDLAVADPDGRDRHLRDAVRLRARLN